MGTIAEELGVAKSTVSYWVRDIVLDKQLLETLKANSHSRQTIEKRRSSRMQRHSDERQKIYNQALKEAQTHIKNPLWCTAVSLYWGEGGKTQRTIRIANSDPAVIVIMTKFFREFCQVPLEKMRGHIHAFPDTNIQNAIKYWSKISGIPKAQFFKTYVKNSAASKQNKKTLPNGTFQVYVHDFRLFIKMMAWIDYLKDPQHYDRD